MNKFILGLAFAASLAGCGAGGTVQHPEDPRDAKIANLERQLREERDVNQALAGAVSGDPADADTKTAQATPQTPSPPSVPVSEPPVPAPPAPVAAAPIPPATQTPMLGIAPYIPPTPGELEIIGFSDGLNPCRDNAYERAQIASALDPHAQRPRFLGGRCARIIGSKTYWAHVRVGSQEMKAMYAGHELESKCARDASGEVRNLPMLPPDPNLDLRWVMPNGRHVVHIDLYQEDAVGTCASYERTITWSNRWPARGQTRTGEPPTGWYKNLP